MAVHRIQLPRHELRIVLRDVPRPGPLAEFQTRVHLRAEGVERIDGLLRVRNDRLLLGLHLGQEVAFDPGVERELDHLGVDHHEFQLRGMLAVEQRRDDGVQSHGLALSRGTGHEQVRHLRQVEDVVLVLDRAPDDHRQLGLRLLEAQRTHRRIHRDDLLVAVRDLDADRPAARDRRDDADARLGFEALRNVVLQALDLRDLDALRLHDLVERHRRTHRGLDALDRNAEIFERLLDLGLVLEDLLVGDLRIRNIVLQQRHGRLAVVHQVFQRIVALRGDRLRVDQFRRMLLDRHHQSFRCGRRRSRSCLRECRPLRPIRAGRFRLSGSRSGNSLLNEGLRSSRRAVFRLRRGLCRLRDVVSDRDLDERIVRIRRAASARRHPLRRAFQLDQPAAAHYHTSFRMRKIHFGELPVHHRAGRRSPFRRLSDRRTVGQQLHEGILRRRALYARPRRHRNRSGTFRIPGALHGRALDLQTDRTTFRRLRAAPLRGFRTPDPRIRRGLCSGALPRSRFRRSSRRSAHAIRRGIRQRRRSVERRILPAARVDHLAADRIDDLLALIHEDVARPVDLVDEVAVDEDARQDPPSDKQDQRPQRADGPRQQTDRRGFAEGAAAGHQVAEGAAQPRARTELPTGVEQEAQRHRPEDHDEEERKDRLVEPQRLLADDPQTDEDQHHGNQDPENAERIVDQQASEPRAERSAGVFDLGTEQLAVLGRLLQDALVRVPAEKGEEDRRGSEQTQTQHQQTRNPAGAVAIRTLHVLPCVGGCIAGSHFPEFRLDSIEQRYGFFPRFRAPKG